MISTNPANGNSIAKGGTVTVYVSKGAAKIKVPNVNGMQQAAAQQKLKNVGFNNVSLQPTRSRRCRRARSTTRARPGGTNSTRTADHAVRLRRRRAGAQWSSGTRRSEAQPILQGQGFIVKTFFDPAPANQMVQPGTVYNQNPAGQTTKPTGTTIEIFVQPQATASPSTSPSASPTTSASPSTSPTPTASATSTATGGANPGNGGGGGGGTGSP